MDFLIALAALAFLMFVAYRGFSVILFAPVAAIGAVLFTDPLPCPPAFTGLFMESMVGFIKNYFPVFLLGALFGKMIELSGFSKSIVSSVIGILGPQRAMLSIVLVGAILTYGGVSLFVVVFAVYPFAAEMFRAEQYSQAAHPRHHRSRRFFLHHGRPAGHAADPEHHSDDLFQDQSFAAPILGIVGAIFIFVVGMPYLESRRIKAAHAGEGYGEGHLNEPAPMKEGTLPTSLHRHAAACSWFSSSTSFSPAIRRLHRAHRPVLWAHYDLHAGGHGQADHRFRRSSQRRLWAVQGALLAGMVDGVPVRLRAAFPSTSPRAARRRSAARCWPRSTPLRNMALAASSPPCPASS